ncbi:MAG TPA: acyl-CoA dehydrogenase family protein, partial [Candidatus Thermoplasmatota archaeon]|nr:acyl-CoA dehydrogenase family protein [Candidatus Thermoplasmatota archaeon]
MAVDFTLTDEQRLIQQMTREFVGRHITPDEVRKWERAGDHPHSIYERMAEQGLLGAPFPQEYGGGGLDAVSYAILTEELAKGCSSLRTSISVHGSLCGSTIKYFANAEQKKRWLPGMASGKKLGAWALTEPGSGSDAAGMQTTAVRKGDHYVL